VASAVTSEELDYFDSKLAPELAPAIFNSKRSKGIKKSPGGSRPKIKFSREDFIALIEFKPPEMRNYSSKSKAEVREEQKILTDAVRAGFNLNLLRTRAESEGPKQLTLKEWGLLAGLKPNEIRRSVMNYTTAKNLLVTSNVGLIRKVIKDSPFLLSKASFNDLFQEGAIGLIRAAELFDPSKGYRFSTFAVSWIKGVLSNYSSETIKVPSRIKAIFNKMQSLKRARPKITYEKMAKLLDIEVEEVKEIWASVTAAKFTVNIDKQLNDNTNSGGGRGPMLSDSIIDEYESEKADKMLLNNDITTILQKYLNPKEQLVITLRFGLIDGEAKTLQQISSIFRVSREQVRGYERISLNKLRQVKEIETFREYLDHQMVI